MATLAYRLRTGNQHECLGLATQNSTTFGVHCVAFLHMTSSASSLLDATRFVPPMPMPSTAA
jgi:hypothetical protein